MAVNLFILSSVPSATLGSRVSRSYGNLDFVLVSVPFLGHRHPSKRSEFLTPNHYDGPRWSKMVPHVLQDATRWPNMAQDGLRCPRMVPNMAPQNCRRWSSHGPNMVPRRPKESKMVQDGPSWPQNCPKMVLTRPKMAPTRPKMASRPS